jgi:transposase
MLVWMKASSLDLRQKIFRASEPGLGSQRAIATFFGGSLAVVEKWLRRHRTTGDIAPRPHAGGRRSSCDAAAVAQGRRLVHEQPDATLAEVCEQLFAQRGLRVSVPPMGRLVLSLKRPRNNSRSTPARATPRGSSRRGPSIRKKAPRSTPDALRSSMHPASTSPCPAWMVGGPGAHGSSAPSPSLMGRM